MLWLFTFFGALAGSLMASIPGLLLGALLGHVLDRRLRLQSWGDLWWRLWPHKPQRDEVVLFLLLGRLAKANGRVLPVHIEQARAEMQRLSLDESAQRQAIEAFSQGKTGRDNLRPLLRARASQGEALLRAAWRMAWVDQQVPQAERELLLLWGKWLGFNAQQTEQLGRDYAPRARQPAAAAGGTYQAALRLLGVSGDSDAEQVKRAYRRLLSKHHPDKLEGSGASAERIREATEMTRQLHQAYALIRQRRGFR